MSTIRASTDAAHAASRRLLEELGFELERQEVVAGLDTVFYSVSPSVATRGSGHESRDAAGARSRIASEPSDARRNS
jgi:hypothetical protein